jgi:hypothetical protein
MSRKFKVPVGLVALASNPATGSTGDSYYNTVYNQIYTFDGSVWVASLTSQNIDGGTPTETFAGSLAAFDGGTP